MWIESTPENTDPIKWLTEQQLTMIAHLSEEFPHLSAEYLKNQQSLTTQLAENIWQTFVTTRNELIDLWVPLDDPFTECFTIQKEWVQVNSVTISTTNDNYFLPFKIKPFPDAPTEEFLWGFDEWRSFGVFGTVEFSIHSKKKSFLDWSYRVTTWIDGFTYQENSTRQRLWQDRDQIVIWDDPDVHILTNSFVNSLRNIYEDDLKMLSPTWRIDLYTFLLMKELNKIDNTKNTLSVWWWLWIDIIWNMSWDEIQNNWHKVLQVPLNYYPYEYLWKSFHLSPYLAANMSAKRWVLGQSWSGLYVWAKATGKIALNRNKSISEWSASVAVWIENKIIALEWGYWVMAIHGPQWFWKNYWGSRVLDGVIKDWVYKYWYGELQLFPKSVVSPFYRVQIFPKNQYSPYDDAQNRTLGYYWSPTPPVTNRKHEFEPWKWWTQMEIWVKINLWRKKKK